MMEGALRSRLRALYPALAVLPERAFAELEHEAQVLRVPRGAAVFSEDSPCQAFPMLLEGAVRVAKIAASGRELVLYRVLPGEACVLTSSCLLGRRDYAARGIAETDTVLVALPRPLFGRLVAEHEAFREYVFALFSDRLTDLLQLVEAVAFQRLDQRLASLLLGKGKLLSVTHQQLADELGSVRVIVSRILKHFAEDGIVALGRERIEILDPRRLRLIAEPSAR
jgi:CRP/FNR family transcriptional regulator